MLIIKNKVGDEDRSYVICKGDFEKGKLYVLINENFVLVSEIVVGVLQDNDKGIIIGCCFFGKGLV